MGQKASRKEATKQVPAKEEEFEKGEEEYTVTKGIKTDWVWGYMIMDR